MRPRGTFGLVAERMCAHAQQPIEVRALAARAEIGQERARYTAHRLIAAGELVVVGESRPMRVVRRDAAPKHEGPCAQLEAAMRAFWSSG